MQFIDLKKQYELVEESLQKRIQAVLQHQKFIMGPEIKELEEKLAEFTGATYCISCSSGTDALLLALMAYGVGPGDAIFTSPFTFIATAEVISLLGATPVFVDIDLKTFNLDPQKLASAVNDLKAGKKPSSGTPDGLRPKGIIPVDLFGLPADYDIINAIARENDLFVLEDACQSFGAEYKGKKACNLADCAATSFFPAKPLGCYGDGGAVFTNDEELNEIMCSLRVHGQGSNKYENVRIGINGRLDTLQAAILLAKMEVFAGEIEMRQRVASRYSDQLKGFVTAPNVPDAYVSAWAQYSVLTDSREDILAKLKEAGIPTAIYYPKPLHVQTAFAHLRYSSGCMSISEDCARNIFSVPMHPYLSIDDQGYISNVISGAA